ncbi:MAG: phage tail tape measure protein [Thermonemataceae bacterium]|nr:phage tail tape measure protein [Thermonemataceae bacterium]
MTEFELKILDNIAQVNSRLSQMDALLARNTNTGNKVSDAFSRIGTAATHFNNINNLVNSSTQALQQLTQPAIEVEHSLASLKAITGATDDQMAIMTKGAKEVASAYGVDATEALKVYETYLSKLSPELAKQPEYLNKMVAQTALLSKTMGGDLAGATDVTATMLNGYNIDTKNAAASFDAAKRMHDMMVGSFNAGSAEVKDIAAAMDKLGPLGYQVGVSFSQVQAQIQLLNQKGNLKMNEIGTALRNVYAIMEQGELMPQKTLDLLKNAGVNVNKLADKTLAPIERFKELQKVAKNNNVVAEVFGKENLVAGSVLLNNLDLLKDFETAAIKTGDATQHFADTMGETTQSRLDKIGARFKLLAIEVGGLVQPYAPAIAVASQFSTIAMATLPVLGGLAGGLWAVSSRLLMGTASLMGNIAAWIGFKALQMGSLIQSVVIGIGRMIVSQGLWRGSTILMTAGQWLLNAAMNANPIGLFIAGVAALGGIVYGVYKLFSNYNPFSLLGDAMESVFGEKTWGKIKGFFNDIWAWIEEMWGKVSDFFTWISGADPSSNKTLAANVAGSGGILSEVYKKANIKPEETKDILGQDRERLDTALPDFNKEAEKGLAGVAGGGAKATNITINLQKLQDKIEVHASTLKESMTDVEKIVLETLLRVLNSANQYQA